MSLRQDPRKSKTQWGIVNPINTPATSAAAAGAAAGGLQVPKHGDHDRRVSKIHTVLQQNKDNDALEPYASNVPSNTIFSRVPSDLDPSPPTAVPTSPNPMNSSANTSPVGQGHGAFNYGGGPAGSKSPRLNTAVPAGGGVMGKDDDADDSKERLKMKEAFHENNKEMYRYALILIVCMRR